MIEQGCVAEVWGRAAAAAAAAICVDAEAEDVPAAPDMAEPEHLVAPRNGRRVHDLAEVESHHGAAGERRAGGHCHPGAGERVEVRSEAACHCAVEELGEGARERNLQDAQMRRAEPQWS